MSRDPAFQKILDEVREVSEDNERRAAEEEVAQQCAMRRWEYCAVVSTLIPGTSPWDSPYELRLAGSERTFNTPDIALRELGEEGWECIQFHQDDGPRQQVIPMSLFQPPPWPTRYTLRFKREVRS